MGRDDTDDHDDGHDHDDDGHDDDGHDPDGHHEQGRVAHLRERGDQARTEATRRLDDAVRRFGPVALVVEAAKRWLSTNASILAGHLAFRFFLFLVPTSLIVVSALGFAAASTDLEEAANDSMSLGGPLSHALAETGAQAQGSRLQLGAAGLVGLTIAGLSLVGALRAVFGAVWGISPKAHKRSRFLTLFGLIVLVAIFYAANALRRRLVTEGLIFTTFGIAAMVVVSGLFIGALSWLLPRRASRLIDLVPGAIVGGVGLTLLNVGAAWYFTDKLETQSQTYGAIGVTLTLLTYLFFWGEIIVLSAVANAVWFDRADILRRDRPAPTPTST